MKHARSPGPVVCVLLAALFLVGCSPAVPPEEVASSFWAATLSGEDATVQGLVLPGSFQQASFDSARHNELFSTVVIGEVDRNRRRALIETRLEGIAYGQPASVEFDTITVIHEGKWKVDYRATSSEMIGALLEDTVIELDAIMREDVLKLEDSFNKSVEEDLRKPPGADF